MFLRCELTLREPLDYGALEFENVEIGLSQLNQYEFRNFESRNTMSVLQK